MIFSRFALIGAVLIVSTLCANAEIIVFQCNLPSISPLVFTLYSDGTPARVGTATGVGSKADVTRDKFGAFVFIETNTDGTPISFSTIQKNMEIIHSRHVLLLDGSVLSPSQEKGRCSKMPL
jgi:hypothetical protein